MKRSLLLVFVVVAYLVTAEFNTRKKAEDFCHSVAVGQPTGELLDQALAAGARSGATRWVPASGDAQQLSVVFTGYYPIFRFTCVIDAQKDAVTGKTTQVVATTFR